MRNDKITVSEVNFKVGRKKHHFRVFHNLPGTFGNSIEGAVDNWLARTEDYRPESLCKYINSKSDLTPDTICLTEAQYDKL